MNNNFHTFSTYTFLKPEARNFVVSARGETNERTLNCFKSGRGVVLIRD